MELLCWMESKREQIKRTKGTHSFVSRCHLYVLLDFRLLFKKTVLTIENATGVKVKYSLCNKKGRLSSPHIHMSCEILEKDEKVLVRKQNSLDCLPLVPFRCFHSIYFTSRN